MHKPPKPEDVYRVMGLLTQKLPLDAPIVTESRYSYNGRPNVRLFGAINRQEWTVDVYAGDFYTIQVGHRPFSTCKGLVSLLTTLYKQLCS